MTPAGAPACFTTRTYLMPSTLLQRHLTARLAAVAMLAIITTTRPAPAQATDRETIVVVKAGTVITGTGEEIVDGVIVIIDGRITHVGRNVDYPRTARVIDATDETVMPGFVHPRTRHGLQNYGRSGVRGRNKAADEVYLELIDFEPMLAAGYTALSYIPAGAGIPGLASVYRTAGPAESRLLDKEGYLRVLMRTPARDKRVFRSALSSAKSEIEKVKKAREEWEKKQAEEKAKREQESKNGQANGSADGDGNGEAEQKPAEFKPPDIDPDVQPLVYLLKGEEGAAVLIEINRASDVLHTDDVLDEFADFPYAFHVSATARDFHYVTETLGERNALILTGARIRPLPNTVIRHNLVADLFNAGCDVALEPSGGAASSLARLRVEVADLIRAGLKREHAIAALTINPARIAGVDDRLGTIEAGKEGDLVFLDGDPFDGLSEVTRTMILGEIVWEAETR